MNSVLLFLGKYKEKPIHPRYSLSLIYWSVDWGYLDCTTVLLKSLAPTWETTHKSCITRVLPTINLPLYLHCSTKTTYRLGVKGTRRQGSWVRVWMSVSFSPRRDINIPVTITTALLIITVFFYFIFINMGLSAASEDNLFYAVADGHIIRKSYITFGDR